jgi:nitrite reductase/ring-hydroxylating ferredoxin subunit
MPQDGVEQDSTIAGETAEKGLVFVCAGAEVPEGSAKKVEVDDLTLAVFNLAGAFFVTDDACSHGPGSLSEGQIEDDIVECNFHLGAFNIRTGAVASPPCLVPIKTYKVVMSGDDIYIDPN